MTVFFKKKKKDFVKWHWKYVHDIFGFCNLHIHNCIYLLIALDQILKCSAVSLHISKLKYFLRNLCSLINCSLIRWTYKSFTVLLLQMFDQVMFTRMEMNYSVKIIFSYIISIKYYINRNNSRLLSSLGQAVYTIFLQT